MLWTAKLTGKQPLRLTEGSTEILIISNVCVLPSTLTPNEKLKVLLKVGGTNSSEKHLVAQLTAQASQRHLQLLLNMNDEPELSLSAKSAEVHLIGYFYPTPLDVEDSSEEEEANEEQPESSEDSELGPIRKKTPKGK